MKFLKPDIEITSKILNRDNMLLKVMCLSIIALAIFAYVNDFSRFGIYIVIAIVAFLFLGHTPEIPNDSWSSGEKASWTKKYTTLKIKDNELIYIYGNSPLDKDVYKINKIKTIENKRKKLKITFKDTNVFKISTKYWNPLHVDKFIEILSHSISPKV